jgi:hypothetical protein
MIAIIFPAKVDRYFIVIVKGLLTNIAHLLILYLINVKTLNKKAYFMEYL